MWSFSSLFPSPGLSELNGSSGITKAQGQVRWHKLPIQLTVCKCSTGRRQGGQPFWQVSVLIYQPVKPSTQVPAVTACLFMLSCKAAGAILVAWQGTILKTDFKIKCTVVLIILSINDVLITKQSGNIQSGLNNSRVYLGRMERTNHLSWETIDGSYSMLRCSAELGGHLIILSPSISPLSPKYRESINFYRKLSREFPYPWLCSMKHS